MSRFYIIPMYQIFDEHGDGYGQYKSYEDALSEIEELEGGKRSPIKTYSSLEEAKKGENV